MLLRASMACALHIKASNILWMGDAFALLCKTSYSPHNYNYLRRISMYLRHLRSIAER
jgi:hypothetical protein